MDILVVYDSVFGNTKKIAEAIAGGFGKGDSVKILHAKDAKFADVKPMNLLIVGSPTHGGRPTSAIYDFMSDIPDGGLAGIGVAAFDTRFEEKLQGRGLRLLMAILGYAATKIEKPLIQKGGHMVAPSEGFFVEGKEGTLKQDELAHAAQWAASLRPEEK